MKIYYHDDYAASVHAFETTRKAGWLNASLAADPVAGLTVEAPSPDTMDLARSLIAATHDPAYVVAVATGEPRDLAESQGFGWDPGIYTMAVAHTAGLVAATQTALASHGWSGSLSSGLHHASATTGAGYCTFNGLAVAATVARASGRERVLVLDFDAHCGGGTYSMVGDLITQVDVSTSLFDAYDTHGDSILLKADAHDYIEVVRAALRYANTLGHWDLVIYNAGMDPMNDRVPFGTMTTREAMVRDFLDLQECPAVFALAGGYLDSRIDEALLTEAHRLTVEAWV